MKRNKVRFNLGRGPRYMKWKVEFSDGRVEYLEPSEHQLVLHGCTLKNNRSTAEAIFNGKNKSVCAWVLCEEVVIHKNQILEENTQQVKYNPRVNPFWSLDGEDMDGKNVPVVYSVGRKLFIN